MLAHEVREFKHIYSQQKKMIVLNSSWSTRRPGKNCWLQPFITLPGA